MIDTNKLSSQSLEEMLKHAINDPNVLKSVREQIGKRPSAAKVSNWRSEDRELPSTLIEGAALALNFLQQKDERISQPIFAEHHYSIDRTGMLADALWNVFIVDENSSEGKTDAIAWKFWQNVDLLDKEKRKLVHTTFAEKDGITDFQSIGDLEFRKTYSQTRDYAMLSCECVIDKKDSPCDVGYSLRGIGAIKTKKTNEQRYEYLGGPNIIPVKKSYIIASIPSRFVKGLAVPWISFAPQLSPVAFLRALVSEQELDAIFTKNNELLSHFSPWGEFGSMSPLSERLELPEMLIKALGEHWPLHSDSRRLFFAEYELPSPLTYQVMIYQLQD